MYGLFLSTSRWEDLSCCLNIEITKVEEIAHWDAERKHRFDYKLINSPLGRELQLIGLEKMQTKDIITNVKRFQMNSPVEHNYWSLQGVLCMVMTQEIIQPLHEHQTS